MCLLHALQLMPKASQIKNHKFQTASRLPNSPPARNRLRSLLFLRYVSLSFSCPRVHCYLSCHLKLSSNNFLSSVTSIYAIDEAWYVTLLAIRYWLVVFIFAQPLTTLVGIAKLILPYSTALDLLSRPPY